ncbi:M56 family metallopeptidase, partial [bacterium]
MVELLLRSTLVCALAAMSLWALRRRSAAVRHAVAIAGLGAILALPFLGWVMPPLELRVLPPATDVHAVVKIRTSSRLGAESSPAPSPVAAEERTTLSPLLIWPLGALLLLCRWIYGIGRVRSRLRQGDTIDGLDTPYRVVASDLSQTPLVAWSPRPTIVLPLDWQTWNAPRLEVVLRHEEAHIRRGDGGSMLLSRLALAAAWINPLVWLLARVESRLAEQAADDLVLA